MTLTEIEGRTKAYAEARGVLADRVQELNDEIEAIKRRRLPGIKKAVAAAAEKKSALASAISEGSDLFKKPRTVVMHGVKVGLEKGKGKIEIEDPDQVIRLIRKYFPDQAEVLIIKTEKPAKKAIAQLTVAELKKLGITVDETGDQIVIKGTDTDVDKLVKALLKEDEDEMKEAA